MPRAAYDTTAEVTFGAGTGTPGAVRMVVACRLVFDGRPLLFEPAVFRHDYYVNWNGPQTSAGTYSVFPPLVHWDASTADIWEIPQGSGQFFQVIRRATIRPVKPGLPFYNRAWLLAL